MHFDFIPTVWMRKIENENIIAFYLFETGNAINLRLFISHGSKQIEYTRSDQARILSPVVNSGSIESLGILKEANTNTCNANHKVTIIHSQKTILIALLIRLRIYVCFFIPLIYFYTVIFNKKYPLVNDPFRNSEP